MIFKKIPQSREDVHIQLARTAAAVHIHRPLEEILRRVRRVSAV